MLLLPFFFGERVYGALNWVSIGVISFQPSEITKIFYIIIGAYFLSQTGNVHIIKFMILTIAIFIILMAQRDLGTALLYSCTFMALVYIKTSNILYPIIGGIVGIIGVAILALIFSHIQLRIDVWLNPFDDIFGSGYQLIQGLFAMGTWGVMGSGLTLGFPDMIPLVTTDFIFAAIVEELGVIVGVCVIFSYLMLGVIAVEISTNTVSLFLKYIVIGYTTFIVVQTFIILAGVMQLIPLTGVTLPFVSYGGSSLLSCIVMIVTVLSIPRIKINEGTKHSE
ncbi:MAG: hypothetical protein BEN19_03910 [Epulopiscium sp. Nuni2H_MBin003]|nr:MAG: hypothetical protein BEN19_03910 [Epulopiscium sp. Nuni2H_MBin003]